MGSLSSATDEDGASHDERMVDLLIEGLRYGAPGVGLARKGTAGRADKPAGALRPTR